MATLKRKNESGNWDYLQLTGKDISDLQQELVSHLADEVKHITAAERTNWNSKAAGSHTHTPSQVGLGNVDNVKQIPASEKGQPNGVAKLDANGKVLNADGSSENVEYIVWRDSVTEIAPGATYIKRITMPKNANLYVVGATRLYSPTANNMMFKFNKELLTKNSNNAYIVVSGNANVFPGQKEVTINNSTAYPTMGNPFGAGFSANGHLFITYVKVDITQGWIEFHITNSGGINTLGIEVFLEVFT
ncbi:hypothetical protein KDN24_12815 [Bacillus sp. Bva_UNVM-123]|uniref:hypothetical protein n=1 Tax=Bacillus sp. Bva_UNVM-123 TaxID=2829798 RepID=UPI00391F8E6F